MELRNRTTGAVITEQQFRQINSNTAFPPVLTPEIIDYFGYDPVFEGPQAETIPPYQYSVRDGVEKINGKWFTKYIVGPVFTDYIDPDGIVHTAAEQYEKYCFKADSQRGQNVRSDRNKRLADCDWTQLLDTPFSLDERNNWALYRETLRMVPQQAGFPWNIDWPPAPGTPITKLTN